jgi:glycosyltransferase involved in cell wall biosynthesis
MSVPALGYVIRMFPQVSETFVANEILSLERLGVPLRIFSLRRPVEHVTHECVRQIQTPVTYLPDPLNRNIGDLIAAQIAIARAAPGGYRAAVQHVALTSIRDRSVEPWKRLLQAGSLATLLRQSNVDRLHAHFAHGSTYVAMLASKLTGLPFSFSAHARDIYSNDSPRLLGEKIAAADFVATCTRANQQYLQDLAPIHGDKINLAYHGVDLEKFSFAAAPSDGDMPVILSVGRLVEKKGFSDLLKACRLLKRREVTFRCVIVGDGPLRANLERRIAALGLGDVVSLLGACSQEELVEHYRQATVLALPCKVLENGDRDGIPNVLVEAMACGVPIVSTGVSGIPELVDSGETGLLVPPGNTTELAAAIELLLHDRDLRERLAARARATVVERFDSAHCARALTGLFGWKTPAAIV